MIDIIQQKIQISKDYIKKNGGAWMVNPDKTPNYELLAPDQKDMINKLI